MKKVVCIMVGIALSLVLAFSNNTTQAQSGAKLPTGKWTLSCEPYFGTGYNSRPAMVSSVKTDMKQGLTVTRVQILNNSSLAITGVKFTWFVTNDTENKKVVLFGTTQLVPVPETKAGTYSLVNFPIVTFANEAHKLVQKGQLEGNFTISVAVTEVVFIDGSSWQEMVPEVDTVNTKIAKVEPVAFRKLSKIAKFAVTPFVVPANMQCPKQKCKYVPASGSLPGYYECEASANFEFCTNCVTTCCVTICGAPPPQCGCS
ncbi:MAG TPA: hypothetical protein PL157_11820 [Acidobacteriota bacterium]|nr:hypothetical protein [Acidobacteriota bacterium]HNH83054.1 hypothetical protein [Acidobacteriota bacterium]